MNKGLLTPEAIEEAIKILQEIDSAEPTVSLNYWREAIELGIKALKVLKHRLDRPELREKIDQLLRSEMVTIGIDINQAKTGQMWAFDSERLSKLILLLYPDEEEIRKQTDVKWIKALMRGGILVSEPSQLEDISKEIREQEKERILAAVTEELYKTRQMFDYDGRPTEKESECTLSNLSISSQRWSEFKQALKGA